MRIAMIFTTILFLSVISSVFAEDKTDYIPYKCHIETANGPNIALFVWDKKQVVEEQSALLAAHVPTISNERLLVKRVIECITEDKKFKDKFIRHLDEQRTDLDD